MARTTARPSLGQSWPLDPLRQGGDFALSGAECSSSVPHQAGSLMAKRNLESSQRVSSPDELRALICALGQRPIAYHVSFTRLPGCDVNTALLLSQLIYWSGRGDDPEWTWKRREKWTEE